MLQIIYGRAGTGKTYTVFEKIKNDVNEGKQVVLLVPEQFTFESERTLLKTLSEQSTTNVSVLSFTRLYDEVSRFVGGRVADLIDDSHKVILMGRALAAVKEQLKLWGRYYDSPKFINALLSSINDMKAAAVTYEQLSEVSKDINSAYLRSKLEDLSLIYGAYEALLGDSFLDPEDNEFRLAENLLKYRYFQNKTVYIDAFRSFTGGQYKIIDRIFSQADDVIFSFTASDIESKKTDIFSNVRKTIQRINKLADKNRVQKAEPINLTEFHYSNDTLKGIEAVFSGKTRDITAELSDNLVVCECETPYDEAEFAARTIRRLVREESYRYKDFVIICRNDEDYKVLIEQACRKNKVFCFTDRKKPIKHLPLTVFINSLFTLVNRFDTDSILNLLKTGLSPLTDTEISDLENYIYIWNINGKTWQCKWNMNTSGLSNKATDIKKIEHLNTLREKIVDLIWQFRNTFKGTPSDMVTALVGILDRYKIADKLKENIAEYTEIDDVTADDIRGCWDIVMDILDGLVKCLPNNEITVKQFVDSWDMAVSFAKIGNIPQMLDEVTFGSADRIKPSRPKVAFVLGANMDIFPKTNLMSGLFVGREREQLNKCGLSLLSTDKTVAIDEEFLVYSSLCCAKDKVFVSYAKQNASGAALEKSSIVENLLDFYKDIKLQKEPLREISKHNLPETEATAISKMCEIYNVSHSDYVTVKEALIDSKISVETYLTASDKSNFAISNETAQKLYGNNLNISATGFDRFHKCKFGYFCKYGLNAKKLEPADFNVLQRGTIVHYVLERAITEHGKALSNFTREECDDLTDRYIEEYLNSVEGFADIVNARMRFLIGKIALITKDVVYHIACEFAQSDFDPKYCELKIGKDETVSEVSVPFGENGKININGSIDRVDVWNGYIRIIDYKTGTKNFRLSDTLVGLNLQMLIYLYCIARGDNKTLSKMQPAGILYMPSKRERDATPLTMNGLILEDEKVYTAMEHQNEGRFIPKFETDKSGNTKGNTYIGAENFEVIFDHIEGLLKKMGTEILLGEVKAVPVDTASSPACKYCDFYSVCCIEDKAHIKVPTLKNSEAIAKMKGEI